MEKRELYTAAALTRLEKRNRRRMVAAIAAACAGLAACVVLCCLTTTANALHMERGAILTSVVTGWIAIGWWDAASSTKRELRHGRMLRAETPDTYMGRVTVTNRRLRIPGAGTFYLVEVSDGKAVHHLRVIEPRRRLLQNTKERLKVYAVHGYVSAWEVTP